MIGWDASRDGYRRPWARLCGAGALALALSLVATRAEALQPEPSGAKGVVTITYTWKSTTKVGLLDADGTNTHTTVVNQTATLTCPVETYGVDETSYIDLSSVQQAAGKAVAGGAGGFQVWFSERCDGTMTANNSQTIVNPRGVTRMSEKVTGTRPVVGESNVTVETDLGTSSSRYLIVPADASGFASEGTGGKKTAHLTAAPEAIVAGPFPGPINAGHHERAVPGGVVTIDWTFQRRK